MLARAFTLQPRLLIADELADYLEPAAVAPLLTRLMGLCQAEGTACLWSTAEAGLARRFADRAYRLHNGQLSPA
jgi:ABC-type glutathione transport system ATPase component